MVPAPYSVGRRVYIVIERLLSAGLGSIELGLLYALMALGVYITFRILNFPDLTVDGSFTTGGGIAAIMITSGYSPLLATVCAFAGGMLAGACTGLLNTKGKINGLLSGILMMIALYSINLRIMGKPNISLLGEKTVFSNLGNLIPFLSQTWNIIIVLVVIVLIVKLLLDWFLYTDFGLALRATGDNSRMIRSFGANTDTTTIVGVSLSNGLVALSGALVAQQSGFADTTMGIGMIVIGLASVIIGETLFGARRVIIATLAAVLGSIVYRFVYALGLQMSWLKASDLKLLTALIVILALTLPMIRNSFKAKSLARKRIMQLEKDGAGQTVSGGGR